MFPDSLRPAPEAVLRSALLWWHAAGVDVLVGDQPHAWLTAPGAPKDEAVAAHPQSDGEIGTTDRPRIADAEPRSLDAVRERLLSDPRLAEAGPPGRRIASSGDPASPLMVMIDFPDEGDAERGALLSGASAALFDAMLAALGRNRSQVYLAALCPGCPPGGILVADALERYAALARAHVAFSGSEHVLLLGSAAIRAILEVDALPLPQGLQLFNHHGAKKAIVAGLAVSTLLKQPKLKGQIWAAMQPLRMGIKA